MDDQSMGTDCCGGWRSHFGSRVRWRQSGVDHPDCQAKPYNLLKLSHSIPLVRADAEPARPYEEDAELGQYYACVAECDQPRSHGR